MKITPMTTARPRRAGFTLIEMLVVISLAVVMIGLAVPMLGVMQNQSNVESGVNSVSVAAQAARAYLETQGQAKSDPLPQYGQGFNAWRAANGGPNVAPTFRAGGTGAGVALVFMPSGEIRLVEHDPDGVIEAGTTPSASLMSMVFTDSGGTTRPAPRFAFNDIPGRDYIPLPEGVVVHGIGRDGSATGTPQLLPPPFAVRFDAEGRIVTHTESGIDASDHTKESLVVYYNGNNSIGKPLGNTERNVFSYNVNASRNSTGYDDAAFNAYDPAASFDSRDDFQRHRFNDFERLETVVGVRVIDRKWYDPTQPDGVADGAPDNAYRYVMFSRYTGSVMRNR